MRTIGTELLEEKGRTLKFIVNESAILFFPQNQEHRDIKSDGLSYEDNYLGNALAGIVTSDRAEIRYHKAFSDERVRNLWLQMRKLPELGDTRLERVCYQGRVIL